MLRQILAVSVGWMLLAPAVWAEATSWKIDAAHSSAQFSVKHMMVSNVKGAFGKVEGSINYDGKNPAAANVDAIIDVNSINTREPARDTHLKGADFLDAAKFPTIKFKSKSIEQSPDGTIKMIGDLTMHGVTKEVSLKVEELSQPVKDPHGNIRCGASASTKINRKDFGVNFNGLLDNGGAMVGDDVAVNIDVEFIQKKDPSAASRESKSTKTGS
jgi:polyisoprenoid-binding protein YceI